MYIDISYFFHNNKTTNCRSSAKFSPCISKCKNFLSKNKWICFKKKQQMQKFSPWRKNRYSYEVCLKSIETVNVKSLL